jgi:excisionase family DNA binding protein
VPKSVSLAEQANRFHAYSELPPDAVAILKDLFPDCPPPLLLTSSQLGKCLGYHERTIEKLVEKRKIPVYDVNGNYRFRLSDVLQAIEKFKICDVA